MGLNFISTDCAMDLLANPGGNIIAVSKALIPLLTNHATSFKAVLDWLKMYFNEYQLGS